MLRGPRRAPALVLATSLLLSLAACSDGGSSADPASESPSTPAPATESSTGAPDPTDSASTADPATGPRLSTEHLTLNVPAGWETETTPRSFPSAADPHGIREQLLLGDIPSTDPDATLQQIAENAAASGAFDGHGRVLAPVTVGGVPMSHVVSRPGGSAYTEEYDAIVEGDGALSYAVTIIFDLDPDSVDAERPQVIPPVLASVRWTS